MDYLYDYYKEKFDEKKHSKFLGPEEFFHYIQRWSGFMGAIEIAGDYYDTQFNVLKVFLDNNKVLYL